MNAPSEEIYSKSTAFNGIRFPIMVNSNRSRVAYRLRDIFTYSSWKPIFRPHILFVDSITEKKPSNIKVFYTSLKSTFNELQIFR